METRKVSSKPWNKIIDYILSTNIKITNLGWILRSHLFVRGGGKMEQIKYGYGFSAKKERRREREREREIG